MSAVAAPRARRKLEPFTIEHFELYTSKIVLDTGASWRLEDFQAEIVEPVLEGVTEVWSVVPEGNAKTTLMAGVALYHADYTYSPWVPIGASSRDQAEILATQAYDMIRRSPGMQQRFRIYEGYRKIVSLRNGGRGIKVYAADTNTGDGVIPTLAICDEGHRYPDLGIYRLWKGKLNKRGGQILMISTAGEPGGEFEEQRDKIREQAPDREVMGAHVRSRGPNIVMNEWLVRDPRKIADVKAVKEANPLSTITEGTLQAEFDSPTTDLGDWKRLKCNIPARSSQTAVTDTEWDTAYLEGKDVPAGHQIDLGIDVAWKHDTFALAPLWSGKRKVGSNLKDCRLAGAPKILTPPRDGSMLDPDEVKAAFDEINERNPVQVVIMDMERAPDIAAWLANERGVIVVDWSQGNVQAAEDYDAFMRALRDGVLKHTGDPGLRKHVMNAIARALPGNKHRFDRPSQSRAKRKQEMRVIDALTALAMVNSYLANPPEADDDELAGEASDYRIERM